MSTYFLEAVRLVWAPLLILGLNCSIEWHRRKREREEEEYWEARYQETLSTTKRILANPQLAELAYPNPELREKMVPMLEGFHQMAQATRDDAKLRKRHWFSRP